MSITINDNLKLNAGKPLDAKYLNGTAPYTSILEVNTLVPIAERSIGLTVNINNNDYWYANGVTDPDLVLKSYGGSPNFCSITLHTDIQVGADVNFTKTDYGSEVDNIDTNIAITRGNSQSIFNQAYESSYVVGAPTGTLWNWSTWGTLEDVKTRNYVNFVDALLNNVGLNVVGAELVMWDTINDKYYKILFNQWTQGGAGGGFSYTRNLITVVCDGSIHFPDGSTLTTGNITVTPTNGLSIITGTSVGLGGQIIQPTVINSTGANTLSIVDDVGTLLQTRDINSNFILNAIYGLPSFTNSNFIFAFTSDGGTSFTNSNIVYNFGGANNFTQTVDTFSFGDYHVFNNVYQSYNLGRNNNITNGSNLHLLGDFNTLSSCSSVNVFGNNNTISSQSNKFYIGNNNKNLVVDNNGYVGIGTDSPSQKLHILSLASGGVLAQLNDSLFNVELTGSVGQFKVSYGANIEFMINPYPNAFYTSFRFKSNPAGTSGECGIEHTTVGQINANGGLVIGEALNVGSSGTNTGVIWGKVIRKTGFLNPNATFYSLIAMDGYVGIGTLTPTSALQVVGLPSYTDNASALGGGLTAGAFYIRTAHGLDVVV